MEREYQYYQQSGGGGSKSIIDVIIDLQNNYLGVKEKEIPVFCVECELSLFSTFSLML